MSRPQPASAGELRKCLFLILDGLGDLPVSELDGDTPLEAASTPNLDRFAASGQFGQVDPIARGVVPNTHTGVGMLIGLYPEQAQRLSRGPVEAAGLGRRLEPGEIAFRANLATLEKQGGGYHVADRRAGRVTTDSHELAQVLQEMSLGDGVTANFVPTDQHRGALVFSGPGLAADVSDTDPGDRGAPGRLKPCRPLQAESALAAEKVNRFIDLAYSRLVDHPLNRERVAAGKLPATGVITRGAGAYFQVDNMLEERSIAAAMVAGCNTVAGLAKTFGLDTIGSAGFTAGIDTDVEGKLAAARQALDRFPMVYVHVKATDLFSHDFQPAAKKAFIERVDRALVEWADSGAIIVLAADHTTDSNSGAHTEHPVPVLIFDPQTPRGGEVINFGEYACEDGNMPRQTGHELLLRVLARLQSSS